MLRFNQENTLVLAPSVYSIAFMAKSMRSQRLQIKQNIRSFSLKMFYLTLN